MTAGIVRTYTNPVFPGDFPDPFVLRFNGHYYAYGTGPAGDGRYFPMLTSRDLVHWEDHGGALRPVDLPGMEGTTAYWAPEVACSEGRFYLYYALGHDEDPDHHLRVATAEHPLGPWEDSGRNLTPHEIFAIDAHPFRDPKDGQWYLYYARDELQPPFAGTGNVVDRLLAMDRLEGTPRPVTRPHADWQLFELKRAIKHDLDWYTVEGPFVVPVGEGYVCFYSGGRWENPNYGVAYARAEHPLGPWKDEASAGRPRLLTTVPDRVIGPGHNSVVAGPDLLSQWIVYHGWDPELTARYPRIDALEWLGGEPYCNGPSWEPRPAPPLPDLAAWFDEAGPGPEWGTPLGVWKQDEGGLHVVGPGPGAWPLREPESDFVAEFSARAAAAPCRWGLSIGDLEAGVEGEALRIGEKRVPLPRGFRGDAWHQLLVRREAGLLTAVLDEYPTVEAPCPAGAATVALAGGESTAFAHFVLSRLPRP